MVRLAPPHEQTLKDNLSQLVLQVGGRVNGSGSSKHPRLQAKTGVCSVQWSGLSWTVSRLPKLLFKERISERMRQQCGVIELSKNSGQENVETVKITPLEQMSERTGEQVGVIELPRSHSKKVLK